MYRVPRRPLRIAPRRKYTTTSTYLLRTRAHPISNSASRCVACVMPEITSSAQPNAWPLRTPTAGPSRRFSASSGARGPATGHSWLATVSGLRRPYFVAQKPPAPHNPHAGFPRRVWTVAEKPPNASIARPAFSVQLQGPLNLLSRRPGASLACKLRFVWRLATCLLSRAPPPRPLLG
jgi:hypothetical protein